MASKGKDMGKSRSSKSSKSSAAAKQGKERPAGATGSGDKPSRATKIAGKGATSAKGTIAAPSAEAMGAPETQRGLMERAATALGSGTSSDSQSVRDAAVTQRLMAKFDAQNALAETMRSNAAKPAEYVDEDGDVEGAVVPPEGQHSAPSNLDATASTITESNESAKTGVKAVPGINQNMQPLSAHRVDSMNRVLTTNQGVPIGDNQNSLKAGLRGPTALEDFILREKLTHFDHERIPERVVHARGTGAYGYFECTEAITDITRAVPFSQVGKRTPVFVRFSQVVGDRGSADSVRDVRGFATKFYTEEGNWDLVGNNIPVFFIQDPIKFPDLVHSIRPEPHHEMPQASSAHDTFWDFVSLMPESAHMLMWQMSDRTIPRSYRMMQGFGVHTFRFINAEGKGTLVKFHWQPRLGTHSLVWDESVRVIGADPDYHRRDLWEAIEGGSFPEWELQVQLFTEEQAEQWSFDVLDATKIIPEELVPLRTIGKLVLDRNVDNFFAETEQVAFCTQHVIPGIDFTNDPLLQGRNFSYLDTQLIRLGGPNFTQIPINRPITQVHNNQRDGYHQHQIFRGRVNYEPNSLAGGCPFQAGAAGFSSYAERLAEASRLAGQSEPTKLRAKPQKFAEHYAQARLFYRSQSAIEQQHIADAFRFELTRVQTPAIRERVVAQLRNVDETLAQTVAMGLGMESMPEALPLLVPVPDGEVEVSPGLSLLARPGDGSIRTRSIALIVADGMDTQAAAALYDALSMAGGLPRYVGARLGKVRGQDGSTLPVEVTFEAMPAVLWDAMVLPAGDEANDVLSLDDHVIEFAMMHWRHNKAILMPYSAEVVFEAAGIVFEEDLADDEAFDEEAMYDEALESDASAAAASSLAEGEVTEDDMDDTEETMAVAGILMVPDENIASAAPQFITLVAQHRAWDRFSGNAMLPVGAEPPTTPGSNEQLETTASEE
jgi:catalase